MKVIWVIALAVVTSSCTKRRKVITKQSTPSHQSGLSAKKLESHRTEILDAVDKRVANSEAALAACEGVDHGFLRVSQENPAYVEHCVNGQWTRLKGHRLITEKELSEALGEAPLPEMRSRSSASTERDTLQGQSAFRCTRAETGESFRCSRNKKVIKMMINKQLGN